MNPGSAGLAHEYLPDGVAAWNPPWAEYALVNWLDGALGVELRRVPYDAAAFARILLDSGMPHAAWLVAAREPDGLA